MIATGLQGKVVIVTGGVSGIGRATSLRFAEEGCRVAVWDRAAADEQLAVELHARGGDGACLTVDVTDAAAVRAAAAAAMQRWSRLDILINNAGITRDALLVKWKAGDPPGEMSDEAFDEVLDVNLRGVFVCTRAVVPHMIAGGGGAIVNAASVVGLYGNAGQTNYAAAKAGVIAMTRTWARELGRHGIRVNAVAPGVIATGMVKSIPEKVRQRLLMQTPLARMGDPREVAEAYVWLASDAASFVHGAVLSIDGGMVIGT
jgi:3-oxoacyl-[acyl-carrier protein] reductase